MSLRAEQWMMLGVVAIGVYAAYRLTKADGGTRADPNPIRITPPLTPQTSASLSPFGLGPHAAPLVAGDLSYGAYR